MREEAAVEHSAPACDAALTHAFALLGKRWNGVLLGSLVSGPAGFAELRRATGGISDSVLSERLGELVAAELVTRVVDAGPPVAVRYELAPAGQALAPVLADLGAWARDHLESRRASCASAPE